MDHAPGFTAADDGDPFDPRQAAALLDQAAAQARRAFTPGTPALFAFRALLVLVVFGGCWLSVRGQHPYSGPTGAVGPVALALVAVNVGWTAWALRRAGSGVSGPHRRARTAWIGALPVVVIAAYVISGRLFHGGASHPLWALYQASAPMLVVGVAGAIATAVGRAWWAAGAFALIVVVAVAAGFAGPAGAWLVMGVGLCAVCLLTAAGAASERRGGVVRL
jgi:hypothetical protein